MGGGYVRRKGSSAPLQTHAAEKAADHSCERHRRRASEPKEISETIKQFDP